MKPRLFRRCIQRSQLSSYRLKNSKKFKIRFLAVIFSYLPILILRVGPNQISKKQLIKLTEFSKFTNILGVFFFLLVMEAFLKSFSSEIQDE
jgi:hypothetical protein